jgi:hypothetical protein
LRFAKHFSDDTFIYSARELPDGGYLLAGSRDVPIIVRLDSSGEIQWVRKFDPGSDLNGYFLSAIETADGGFLAVGEIGGSDTDPIIVKLNNAGKILWQRQVAAPFGDHLPFVMQSRDGSFLLVGRTGVFSVAGGTDCWAIKLNESGNLLWSKVFGLEGDDQFIGAIETVDAGYILGGTVNILGTTERPKIFVTKIDAFGTVQWQMLYSTPALATIGVYSAARGGNNSLYLGGAYSAGPPNGTIQGVVIKLNANGRILWKKTYHRSDNDTFYSVAPTPDGGIIAAGESSGNFRGFQAKIQTDGHVNWSRKTLGPITFDELALNGGFLAISEAYIWPFFHMVIRTDSSGKTECGILKRSSVRIGQPSITRQTGNVTVADVAIHFKSPRLSVRRTSVRVQDPCASSIQKESACSAPEHSTLMENRKILNKR